MRTHSVSWDHRVRAKFLMDARVEDAVSAIHLCCLPEAAVDVRRLNPPALL